MHDRQTFRVLNFQKIFFSINEVLIHTFSVQVQRVHLCVYVANDKQVIYFECGFKKLDYFSGYVYVTVLCVACVVGGGGRRSCRVASKVRKNRGYIKSKRRN